MEKTGRPVLEICCFNVASALAADAAGADRIELCADPGAGGTTPATSVIRAVRAKVSAQLYPIVRVRGGDFLFDAEEYEVMMQDIATCREAGCDGVVIGMLRPDGRIDRAACAKMVEKAYPMGVTFHRAFDWTANPFEALETVIGIGCERVLTSGQQPTAILGANLIRDLVAQADGRIAVMPGSGVRAHNIAHLRELTRATEFHSSARMQRRSAMQFVNAAMQEDQLVDMVDPGEVRKMKEAIGRNV